MLLSLALRVDLNETMLRAASLLLFLFVLGLTDIQAQCNSNRYLEPIFTSTRTHENVSYNLSYALIGGCTVESLQALSEYTLDIYEPDGDTLGKRPCIVYAHGGAFLIGDKRIIPVEEYCYEMAKRGFVVFSIDYRKCFNTVSTPSIERAVYRAVQDMNAAIRWVKTHADIYRVDSNMVFSGGNSAGSIMAIFNAYGEEDERVAVPSTYNEPDMGCMNCSGNSFIASPKPRAILNYWGATLDTNIIETGDQPMLSMHGNADNAVPFDYGVPFSYPAFPPVYGSMHIDARLEHLGIPHQLYVFEGMGHEPWLTDAAQLDTIVNISCRFLFEHFLKPPTPIIEGPQNACLGDTVTYQVTNADSNNYYCWFVSVLGDVVSSNYNKSTIEVAWTNVGDGFLAASARNVLHGESDYQSMITYIDYPPTIAINSDTTICEGDTVQLTSGLGHTYSWSPSSGLSADDIPDPLAFPDTTTTYTISITYGACESRDSVTIAVNSLPYIYAGPDGYICQGQNSFTLDGWPIGNEFSWYPQYNLNPPGGWHPVATPDTTTTYIYSTTDTNGCSNSDIAVVYVNPLPAVDIVQSGDSLIAPDGYMNYQWLLDGQEIQGANSSTLLASTIGGYSVVVTDTNGCYGGSEVFQYVGIEENETLKMLIYPNPAGDLLNIRSLNTLSGSTIEIFDLNGKIVYQGEITIEETKLITLNISPLAEGMYYLLVSGESKSAARKLVISR